MTVKSPVRIENIADLRKVAAELNIDAPVRQGRPPTQKVAKALAEKGIDVDPTPYFSGVVTPKPVATHKPADTQYEVRVKVPQVNKVTGEVKRNKREEVVYNSTPTKTVLSVADIRKLATTTGRGRVSESAIMSAVVAQRGWEKFADLLKDAQVTKVPTEPAVTTEEACSNDAADVPAEAETAAAE